MRTTFTAACICLPMSLPARFQAAPLTDRAIAASENMLGGMLTLLKKCVPSLAGKLGDGSLPPFLCPVEDGPRYPSTRITAFLGS